MNETTSEVFKTLTKNQDDSLKEKQKIVKEICDLSISLKAIKHEPKVEEAKKKNQTKKKRIEKKKQNWETKNLKHHCIKINV